MYKLAVTIATLGAVAMLGSSGVSAATVKKKTDVQSLSSTAASESKTLKRSMRTTSPGSDRMLNPQPLPPGQNLRAAGSPGSDRMLNPQPLPPGKSIGTVGSAPGSDRMLNPQPLPPGKATTTIGNSASERMLNPQPLPPKQIR